MTTFVLVHSPAVGPTTWRWVGGALTAFGHRVVIPCVPAEVTAAGWEAIADAVAEQGGECDEAIVVGHSGAGPLLPQIAARSPWRTEALVFVDAAIPPEAGEAELMPDSVLADLRPLADGGLLPPWSDWFGASVMRELIPDHDKRAAVSAELPRLPLSYFESRVPVPDGWATAKCGYLLLSEAYAADAAEATVRGWPIAVRIGAHLDIVTRPAIIADAIAWVTSRLMA